MSKLVCDWKEFLSLIKELGEKIDFNPDVIIAIGNGGWIPARIIKGAIDEKEKKEMYSLSINYYDKGKKLDKPKIKQSLKNISLKGKSILVVDEVADSGRTLEYAVSYLKGFNPTEIRTAVVHKKRTCKFNPDYFVKEVDDVWICYPYDKF